MWLSQELKSFTVLENLIYRIEEKYFENEELDSLFNKCLETLMIFSIAQYLNSMDISSL